MTFHESTIKKLRLALAGHQDQLEQANMAVDRRRTALADAQEELGYAEEKAAVLKANVADCQRWLDFAALCDLNEDLAHAFANAVLDRDAEIQDAREDTAAEPTDTARDISLGDLVNVCDPTHKRFGQRGKVIGFAYQPDEIVIEYDNLGSCLYLAPAQLMHHAEFVKQGAEQDARDAEAANDAMSASERFEHDQADEARIDAESEAGR